MELMLCNATMPWAVGRGTPVAHRHTAGSSGHSREWGVYAAMPCLFAGASSPSLLMYCFAVRLTLRNCPSATSVPYHIVWIVLTHMPVPRSQW